MIDVTDGLGSNSRRAGGESWDAQESQLKEIVVKTGTINYEVHVISVRIH